MKKTELVVSQKSSTLVRQPYAITVAKHSFNVHEMRIMTRITEALQKDMEYGKTRVEIQETLLGDKIVHIPTKLLLRDEGSTNYSAVRRALKSLESKTMTITAKDKHGAYVTTSRLIMKSKYYLNNEMVEIQLDRDILPDYLALACYSKYMVEVSVGSSSSYIMRLYQFVCHWKDKKKKTVMIDELRQILEIGDKYSKPKDLRKHILEPCIKDLKERADVWFEIDSAIKMGRSVVGYVFKIYKRSHNLPEVSAHEQHIRDTLRATFGFGHHHISQLQEIISREELHPHIYEKMREIEAQVVKGNVKNVKAYALKALQNEFSKAEDDPSALRHATGQAAAVAPEYAPQPSTENRPLKSRQRQEPASIGEHIAALTKKFTSK